MNKKKLKIIGLTGPIGAGKDAVAKILRRKGAAIIDADKVAHTLYKDDKSLRKKIIKSFGTINRRKLGEIVFGDKKKLKLLNQIVHPALKKAIIASSKLKVENSKLIIINAAVLKEIGLVNFVDEVWIVMASQAKRLKRLLKSGLSKKQADARLRSQMSQKKYLRMADRIIWNNGTLKQLSTKVAELTK